MLIALHSGPRNFFRTDPPYDSNELIRFAQKAVSLGFKGIEIGPLSYFGSINPNRLKLSFDNLGLDRRVHVGGTYDATKFALQQDEIERARKEIRQGMDLSLGISSTLVSLHPPFFPLDKPIERKKLIAAKTRFLNLLREEVNYASTIGVRMALESFCYPPFIFNGISDYLKFVSNFPSDKLGVLLDAGHVYQVGMDLHEVVSILQQRLLEIHVHDATRGKDYRKSTHLAIGKGTIDFPKFIKHLQIIGYEGPLVFEIRGNQGEIVRSKEYIEHLINVNA